MDLNRTGWAIVHAATGKQYVGKVVGQYESGGFFFVDMEEAQIYVCQYFLPKDPRDSNMAIQHSVAPIDFLPDVRQVRLRAESISWFSSADSPDLAILMQKSADQEKVIRAKQRGLIVDVKENILKS